MELGRHIRSMPGMENIGLLLITAHETSSDFERARQAGFNSYMGHPIKDEVLAQHLVICLTPSVKHSRQIENISPPPLTSGTTTPPETMNGKILLAEDNIINQQVTSTILRKAGYEVDIANNGDEAINMWREKPYDLILMDWHMPILDGLDATRLIRNEENGTEHIPVIALTANAMQGHEDQVYAAGMDGYLTKPFQARQLLTAIKKYSSDNNNQSG